MLCFGFLFLDFSTVRGTTAEYSAGRNMKGRGGAAALAWDDGCLGGCMQHPQTILPWCELEGGLHDCICTFSVVKELRPLLKGSGLGWELINSFFRCHHEEPALPVAAASNVYGNILPWFEEALAAFHKQAVLQHVVLQGRAFLPVRSDSRNHLILATKQC